MISELQNINIRPFNSFRIDAKCERWIEYTSPDDIPVILNSLDGKPFMNIGAGSNMLFTEDFHGSILHSKILDLEMTPGQDATVKVKAGAGITFDTLIEQLATAGIWGAENLSGIPGEVGAAAVQNVGAYGVEACDIISNVSCYDTVEKRFKRINVEDCGYGYRNSMFKSQENRNRYIITAVEFDLSTLQSPKLDYGSLRKSFSSEPTSPMEIRTTIIQIRNEKLPDVAIIGSAGSFFKNPIVDTETFKRIEEIAHNNYGNDTHVPHYDMGSHVKIPAAWLIDKCGLKGYRIGGAAVWNNQPLVIVNISGHASAKDILDLECHITNCVESEFGIRLYPEVEHITNKINI